jgi:hypothetical protein
MGLGGKVAIVGENVHQSLTDMIGESVTPALQDARIERDQGARTGFAHNVGGPGAVSAVAVLSQP